MAKNYGIWPLVAKITVYKITDIIWGIVESNWSVTVLTVSSEIAVSTDEQCKYGPKHL